MKSLLIKLKTIDKQLPHGSNLITKIESTLSKNGDSSTLERIAKEYLKFIKGISEYKKYGIAEWVKATSVYFESYYNFLKLDENKKFSHQSDFLSSLLPEYIYLAYKKLILPHHFKFELSTQRDIVIDMSFLPYEENFLFFKQKRVDVAIVKPIVFKIDNEDVHFNAPIVAIEVKTNLDKNMISGVEYSVERLKQTFPLCQFYLISELADFAFGKQNYAGTSIDEILILRKQKRAEVRRNRDSIKPIDIELFTEHILEVNDFLNRNKNVPENLKNRMQNGTLIKGI